MKKINILKITTLVAIAGVSLSGAYSVFAEGSNVVCKYKSDGAFVMTCEKNQPTENSVPQDAEPEVEPEPEPEVEPEPEMEPEVIEQTDDEDIEVPMVGDTTDDGYVEPLGEEYSWYPDEANSNIINYQYGKTSEFVASLTNPEEGITASDVVLIVIIALSCLTITTSVSLLTTRAVGNRVAKRKNFTQRNPQ